MTAEPVDLTDERTSEPDGFPKPETRAVKDSRGWFVPGNNANPYGRRGNPEKKTAITELRRKADKKASALADALIKTALSGNVRAFVAIRDTAYGVPAQKLVIENADAPADELLMRMMARRGLIPGPADPPALPPASE